MSDTITGLDNPPITLEAGQGRAESSLRRLALGDQPFLVLKQRGAYPDIVYDHGRLLAAEMEHGALPEIVSLITRGADLESDTMSHVAAGLYQCYSERVERNLSDEFGKALDAIVAGYRDGIANPRFSAKELRDAIIAIEVGNVIDALMRIFEIPGIRAARGPGVLAVVLPYLSDDVDRDYLERATQPGAEAALRQTLARRTGPNGRFDFACTGFSVPGTATRDGRHLHARNLDADLYNWNRAPVLSLIDETPANAGFHKYAAFGTAGLIFPGGISGLNDAGIAASLHQMSTTAYDSNFLFSSGDIAPFVQQRILRECATLDEAADLVKDTHHFAAWTMFCSDAKTGEAIRLEINGEGVKVSYTEAEPVAQTNHFLHPDFVERHFDEKDAHFTPTFGKWLETHARFDAVSAALEENRTTSTIDIDWAIDRLASGLDGYLEPIRKQRDGAAQTLAAERSYGRVPRKVYGQLGSIVIGDPDRRPGRDEVWMTAGDKMPSPHCAYLGWAVDWDGFDIAPVADGPVRRTQQYINSGRSNWEESLTRFLLARLAVCRFRDDDGQLLRRSATEAEEKQGVIGAASILDTAIGLAGEDRIVEVPYHYMRARMRHGAGDLAGAKQDWDLLRDIWAKQNGAARIDVVWPVADPLYDPLMHPYEAALVAALSTATEDLLNGTTDWPGRSDRLAESRALLHQLKLDHFGADNPAHFDLVKWLEKIDEIDTLGGAAVELPEPHFVTVE